jgi:hypothetical protein
LGTFRDIRKAVLDLEKIRDNRLFRLWGWGYTVVVRSDLKEAIEDAGITGCRFKRLAVFG